MGREAAVDQFRGLAVALMVPANYLEHVRAVPAWLKHAPDIGLTVVDLVAPFFVFAIGLTLGASVRRRLARDGAQAMLEHHAARALALIGLGTLFSIGEVYAGYNPHGILWGTLQALGAASLLGLPCGWLPPWPRAAAAVAVLGAYQWQLDAAWLEVVLRSSHAGIQGAPSWAALLVLATVFADLRPTPRRFWALALIALGAGLALSGAFPISKHRMSISFVLVASACSALAFAALERAVARRPIAALALWGRNPLVLYVSHLVLLSVFLVPEAPGWHVEAPLAQVVVQGAAYAAVLHLWARGLDRRGVHVKL